MTYKERVHQLAEKMAEEKAPISWPKLTQEGKELLIKRQLSNARTAVSEMADAVREFVLTEFETPDRVNWPAVDNYLIQKGLIPAQEGGQDGKV